MWPDRTENTPTLICNFIKFRIKGGDIVLQQVLDQMVRRYSPVL